MLRDDELYDAALKLATEAHEGQKRWGGEPYITHPIAVAQMINTSDMYARAVALLHDVIEDTTVTYMDILSAGFPVEVAFAVLNISKQKNDSYAEYISRVAHDDISRKVKKVDIQHNLTNLKKGSMKDKYLLALEYFRLYEKHND